MAQVWCVTALSNGHVVSGSYDNTLMVWDVTSGQCLKTLTGHTDWARRRRPGKQSVRAIRGAQVNCVTALPNGHVVSGSRDHTLKVWDVLRGRLVRTLSGHTNSVRRRRPVEPRVDRSSTP